MGFKDKRKSLKYQLAKAIKQQDFAFISFL